MSPHTNELLAHIPDEEFMSMTRNMKLVSLVKGQTLFEAGQIPSEVHYPVGAVASMMIELSDGFSVEAHMFGKACMVGVGTINDGISIGSILVSLVGAVILLAIVNLFRRGRVR